VFAVADALHEEYKAIIDAGLILQVDDAYLALTYEVMVPPKTPKGEFGGKRRLLIALREFHVDERFLLPQFRPHSVTQMHYRNWKV
jgi:hypothetical protein